jgi:hypothetical protein
MERHDPDDAIAKPQIGTHTLTPGGPVVTKRGG